MGPDAGCSAWDYCVEGLSSHKSDEDDVFALVADVGWDGIPPPEYVQDAQASLRSRTDAAPGTPTQLHKSKKILKLEKLRARNRLAQARYRRKAKVWHLPSHSSRARRITHRYRIRQQRT